MQDRVLSSMVFSGTNAKKGLISIVPYKMASNSKVKCS